MPEIRRSHPFARAAVAVALLGAFGTARPVSADEAGDYRATSHRRFDDVAHWSRQFDEPGRDEWQKPKKVVEALGIKPGMRVADLGAGTGYFSRFLSTAVGETGVVFSVEVEPNLLAHLRERAEKEKTANVIPVLASADNPRLPAAALDLILFVDTYHHVDARERYLGLLRRSLAPGGRIGIIEWKPGKLPKGPKEEHHKIPRDRIVRELAGAGFELDAEPELLAYQYFLVFSRDPGATNGRDGLGGGRGGD